MDARLIAQLGVIGFTFFMLLNSAAILVYMERKVAALVQQRYGPYLVGPKGLLQPLADIIKLMMKEELRPHAANKWLFYLAPVVSATAAFAAFSVVPFGAPTTFFGLLDEPVNLAPADVNVGLLVIFAITSMGVYGIVLAGWSSNSKYSLLGALRASAQMISYELSYGLSFAAVILMAGSLSLGDIVDQQSGYWFGVDSEVVHLHPAARVLHFPDGRRRRDEPRALRFSGSRAGTGRRVSHRIQLDEFRAVLPRRIRQHGDGLRGRDGSLPGRLARPVPARVARLDLVPAKVFALLFFYIWMRWTLPRYRYDQLMEFGWKYLLPLAVVNLLVTAYLTIKINGW